MSRKIRRIWSALLRAIEFELIRLLPLFWAIRWLRFLGQVRYWRKPQSAQRRMCALFPDASSEEIAVWAREGVINYSIRSKLNFLLWKHDPKVFQDRIHVQGLERIEKALEGGRGVVLLGTHVGVPRLLRWYLKTENYSVYYLVKMTRDADSLEHWLVQRLRRRHGLDTPGVIGEEPLGVQYMKKAYNHLRRNGLVFIAGDGNLGERRLAVQICGNSVEIGIGGLTLGMLASAVVLPCFSHLDSRLQQIYIDIQEPLVLPDADLPQAERLQRLGAAYASRVEGYILRNPTQAPLKGGIAGFL